MVSLPPKHLPMQICPRGITPFRLLIGGRFSHNPYFPEPSTYRSQDRRQGYVRRSQNCADWLLASNHVRFQPSSPLRPVASQFSRPGGE